jgi:hypothetical protein
MVGVAGKTGQAVAGVGRGQNRHRRARAFIALSWPGPVDLLVPACGAPVGNATHPTKDRRLLARRPSRRVAHLRPVIRT